MTAQNLYVDVHVLQTVPSSNLNRDDTGAPKTALYGGVLRSRVSSQSWKHAMRALFKDEPGDNAGLRTKKAANELVKQIQTLAPEMSAEDALGKASEIFKTAGIKLNSDNETGALLLISHGQIAKLAQYALDNDAYDKKALKALLKGDQSVDLALFGRMVADDPELNVDAAAQVAHALSTHQIEPEFDYFTAVDDTQADDESGAAMLGSIGYNSSTLYRYANVNVHELAANLGDEAAIPAVAHFIKDFALSMPSGKQNTFANKTVPGYLMVSVRTDTPVNLVSAFEKPIQASGEGYMQPSIARLEHEYAQVQQFVQAADQTFVLGKADSTVGEQVANLDALLSQVTATLEKVTADEHLND